MQQEKPPKTKFTRSINSLLNVMTGFGGQILYIFLNFITRTVFVMTLGKSYLGINGLFSDILMMLSLTELGLDTAINYKLYQPLANGDRHHVQLLMKFYRDAYRVVGTVIMVLGICLIPALPYLIRDYDSLQALHINAACIFLLYLLKSVSSYLFFASRSAIVRADQREYLLNVARYVVDIVSCICQILILLFRKSFIEYTVCLTLFVILQNCVYALIAQKNYPWAFTKTQEKISKEERTGIFKDLGALFSFKINDVVLNATDNTVLSVFIGLGIVGMYSNYRMLYLAITDILAKFYSAIIASMGNLFATSDSKKKYTFFEAMNWVTVLFYGTACIGITVVANELIGVWLGSDYVIPMPFPLLLGIEVMFMGAKKCLNYLRNATGVFQKMWWRPVLGSIVNIVVSILLVQKMGICGVLLGTVTADFSTFYLIEPYTMYKYCLDDYTSVSHYYTKSAFYAVLLVLTGAADWWLCTRFCTGWGWLSVFIHAILCGVSVPVVFSAACWNWGEVRYIKKILIGILQKVTGKRRKEDKT